jgi:hypothetical protein
MQIREHEGFQIQIRNSESGYMAEVYRKENLLKIIRGEETFSGEKPFSSAALALEAAQRWSDTALILSILYTQ